MQNIAIFTVCNLAYIPKALVLARSVRQFNSERLRIYLIDRKVDVGLPEADAELVWIEDCDIPNLYQLAFMYDIIEFSTSLKPTIALQLLREYDAVIFLDPDTCVYSPLSPIVNDLQHHAVILTPHYLTPQTNDPGESDVGMMRFGSFNLGFFAVRREATSLAFLNWWADRCARWSFMESQFGLSTDQKWVSIAPCLFPDLYTSRNPGYNAAAWNTFERRLTRVGDSVMVNDRYPLIFFHFSNFDHNDPEYLNKRSIPEQHEHKPVLLWLGAEYSRQLKENNLPICNVRYAFDYMSEGEYISPTLRRAYASVISELPQGHDPFDSKGVVGDFARKNFLFEKKNERYRAQGYAESRQSANVRRLKYIYIVLRLVLRIVGPNSFYNLSRLLVYLSSYRQNRQLWKL